MNPPPKPKSRLGRGLSSLISMPVEKELPEGEAVSDAVSDAAGADATGHTSLPSGNRPAELEVSIDLVRPNPHQPRRTFNEASLNELANSIKANGLIQPVVARKTADGYELIAGERRLRASKLAGLQRIPVLVREVDALTQAQMALVENIQREDLNPLERAEAYRMLMEQLGLTTAELAFRMGEDRSTISHFIRLLDLTEVVREMVRDGRLSMGHAKLLAPVDDHVEQQRLANLVLAQNLSVRNLERLLESRAMGQTVTAPPPASKPANTAHYQDLERSLSRQLGMKVQVRAGRSKGKGKLLIHYANLDQFDELMKRLDVVSEE